MRCYKIVVGGKTLFELNGKNPIAPRIRFDIRTYRDQDALAVLEIYNLDFKYFVGNKSLINKELELHAWIAQTPMTRNIGYTNESSNTLIYRGKILNLVPNYNLGESTCLTILLGTAPKIEKKAEKKVFLNFKKDIFILNEITSALKKLYPDMIISSSASKAKTLRQFLVKANMQTEVKDINDIQKVLDTIKLNNTKEHIQIYNDGKNRLIIGTNVLSESDVTLPNYSIRVYDLLEQPQYIQNEAIQLSLRISGKYKILDTFLIPNNIAFNISSISSSVYNQNYDYSQKVFFSGLFQINKVWHVGDTHNIQAQQWATNIEATPVHNNT